MIASAPSETQDTACPVVITESWGSLLNYHLNVAAMRDNDPAADIAIRAHVNPSYLSRLRYQHKKAPSRLIAICIAEALQIPEADRSRMLSIAGYMPWEWSPLLERAAHIIATAEPVTLEFLDATITYLLGDAE